MAIQGKIWGTTEFLFSKNNVSIHRICGKKGGYCSKHKHNSRWNKFYVESGILMIEQWNDDIIDVTELKSGESCEVPPEKFHRFTVVENCVAYEIYWVELDDSDILRETHGGIKAGDQT